MSDSISRQAAIDALIEWYGCEPSDLDYFKEIVEKLPSADRPQGEWKSVKASIYPYGYDVECSVCGHRMGSSFGYKYCPMCGSHMKGADDDV